MGLFLEEAHSFSSFFSLWYALSAAHQFQCVKVPEADGRMIPFGEGLDPNQDI